MGSGLSPAVTAAVLCGALMHAGWNALVKRSGDALCDLALITLAAALLAAALLPVVPVPPPAAWPFLLASVVIHVGYYVTLVATYRHADLGIGYPLMRGSAPLLVALVGIGVLGERPTPTMWLGIGLISGGIASLALAHGRRHGAIGPVLGWALANASMIAGYTLVDAAGARAAGDAVGYVAWMFFLEGLPFAAVVFALRREAFVRHVRARWRLGLAGGAMSALAYGIAVWAMTRAPVAAVAALRETSVVFAALIGVVLLKERASRARWAGIAAVVAGAAVLHG